MIVHPVDITQNKKIKFVITAIVALGALSGFLVWVDSRKHQRLRGEIMDLEKQIKELQLSKLKAVQG